MDAPPPSRTSRLCQPAVRKRGALQRRNSSTSSVGVLVCVPLHTGTKDIGSRGARKICWKKNLQKRNNMQVIKCVMQSEGGFSLSLSLLVFFSGPAGRRKAEGGCVCVWVSCAQRMRIHKNCLSLSPAKVFLHAGSRSRPSCTHDHYFTWAWNARERGLYV